jgi:hypothetical protein
MSGNPWKRQKSPSLTYKEDLVGERNILYMRHFNYRKIDTLNCLWPISSTAIKFSFTATSIIVVGCWAAEYVSIYIQLIYIDM